MEDKYTASIRVYLYQVDGSIFQDRFYYVKQPPPPLAYTRYGHQFGKMPNEENASFETDEIRHKRLDTFLDYFQCE